MNNKCQRSCSSELDAAESDGGTPARNEVYASDDAGQRTVVAPLSPRVDHIEPRATQSERVRKTANIEDPGQSHLPE
jgi:hypothetical protein